MNRHFMRPYEGPAEIPASSYGRLESHQIEIDTDTAVLNFDLIDAKWLDNELEKIRPQRDHLGRFKSSAKSWLELATDDRRNPFDTAPLFRLVIKRSFKQLVSPRGLLKQFAAQTLEETVVRSYGHWMQFKCMSTAFSGSAVADVYPGIFAAPLPAFAHGKLVTSRKHKRLTALHDLSFFLSISPEDLALTMSESVSDALAVYDVGQGNSNALLQPGSFTPTMYYDLGAGIYANKNTTPSDLRFCFSHDPIILLSHWDTDHWAGAYARQVGGKYPALEQRWIAPLQDVTSSHLAFAFDIWLAGGDLKICKAPAGMVYSTINQSGHEVSFWRGTGNDPNGSGFVVQVENITTPSRPSWLLTGDCDYRYFPMIYQKKPQTAIVAPHHGADLSPTTAAPSPSSVDYGRLLYSYGPNNTHSGVSHPTIVGVNTHESAGWTHAAWYLSSPGYSSPAGNFIRATSFHSSGSVRGGILVGWTAPPKLVHAPCPGNCTIMPTQN